VRVAVSGSHGAGKSTLIAAFLARRPDYRHEPEAYEPIGDDVDVVDEEGPTPDGLHSLIEHTLAAMTAHAPGARVVHERSPADYIAYAAARRAWPRAERRAFVAEHLPMVRAGLAHLDRIVLLPLVPEVPARPGEDERFRRRVDEELRRALLDDEHDLFSPSGTPRVVALSARPSRWADDLLGLVG
jgi:hypothetical protein